MSLINSKILFYFYGKKTPSFRWGMNCLFFLFANILTFYEKTKKNTKKVKIFFFFNTFFQTCKYLY